MFCALADIVSVEREVKSYKDIFKLFRQGALASIAVQTMTSLTGVNFIQYYQTILFKSLDMSQTMILALAGLYGTCVFTTNLITTVFLTDRWGRRPMLLTGLTAVILTEIYTAVMQRSFQDTGNRIGKGFTILGIYLFCVLCYGMLNSTTWLYGAEILPMALRSKVMGKCLILEIGIPDLDLLTIANRYCCCFPFHRRSHSFGHSRICPSSLNNR